MGVVDKIKSGHFNTIGNVMSIIGSIFGIIGLVLAFIYNAGVIYGIIALVLIVVCIVLEVPQLSNKITFLKNNIFRSVWYLVIAIVFFVLPNFGWFIVAGIFFLLASIAYGIGHFRTEIKSSPHGGTV